MSIRMRLILTNGIAMGAAISSRFWLNLQNSGWAAAVSFLVLFLMFTAITWWLRIYREKSQTDCLSFGQVMRFTIVVFVIGAIVSSLFKYYYFSQMKPFYFQALLEESAQMMREMDYSEEMIFQSKNLMTPEVYAFGSFLVNSILGVLMGLVTWPMIRNEQKMRKLQ